MKKFLSLVLAMLILISLNACDSEGGSVGSIFSNELTAGDLSIEDFLIETKKIKENGKDYYVATINNNSEYPIVAVQLDYEPKDSVPSSELSVFNDFMEEHNDYIEGGSISGVILRASAEKLAKKGESIENIKLSIGYGRWSWYNTPNKEQVDLMEPKELQIGVIGENNLIYVAYYNYNDKEWVLDEETVQVNNWPQTSITEKVVKPNCEYIVLDSDIASETEISFDGYGINKADFKNYLKDMQTAGFELKSGDDFENSYSDIIYTDELYVSINYNADKEKVSVIVRIENQ